VSVRVAGQEGMLAVLRRQGTLAVLTGLQAGAALVFAVDMLTGLPVFRAELPGSAFEAAAVVLLWAGSFAGARELRRLAARTRGIEETLRIVTGGMVGLLRESFARWRLTPSERDVALLAFKGLSIAEIAALRQSRHGTVKAHLVAVYRKAGVDGRTQLIGRCFEAIMAEVTVERAGSATSPAAAG
jgi:DNA-binding CsgD family transcriptional regulator